MKASEAVSHEKSKRWKVRGYADRLAQLGPVEVAVYAKTRRENLMRLLKNGFFKPIPVTILDRFPRESGAIEPKASFANGETRSLHVFN